MPPHQLYVKTMSSSYPVSSVPTPTSVHVTVTCSSNGTSAPDPQPPGGTWWWPFLPHVLLVVLLVLLLLADFLRFRHRSRQQLEHAQEKQVLAVRFPKNVIGSVFRVAPCPPDSLTSAQFAGLARLPDSATTTTTTTTTSTPYGPQYKHRAVLT